MEFTATQWDTPEDKAKFLKDLQAFVLSGFARKKFARVYKRLSCMFGHIAHHNVDGFWGTWFQSSTQRQEWVKHARSCYIYGDPAWTWSDVENVFQKWLREQPLEEEQMHKGWIEDRELKDDLVQDMIDVLTSFCARLYGRRAAKNRAKRALEAAAE